MSGAAARTGKEKEKDEISLIKRRIRGDIKKYLITVYERKCYTINKKIKEHL